MVQIIKLKNKTKNDLKSEERGYDLLKLITKRFKEKKEIPYTFF